MKQLRPRVLREGQGLKGRLPGVLEQQPVGSSHYNAGYFTGGWRDAGNNYNLETRRQIEAKNPLLIKDMFQPKKALDLGCGPRALMHLLFVLEGSRSRPDLEARMGCGHKGRVLVLEKT